MGIPNFYYFKKLLLFFFIDSSKGSKLKRIFVPVAVSALEKVKIDNHSDKKIPPFLIKSKTICGHLIRVHFFIDHGGYSIGASVRKLHFCSMCSKETQMKRIFYYGKQTLGPNQINLESHQNFTKIFFYGLDSVRDWQFLK